MHRKQKHLRLRHQKLRQPQRAHLQVHQRLSLQNRLRQHQKQKLRKQRLQDRLHSRTEMTASSAREMAREAVISVRAKAATIIAGTTTAVTEMATAADLVREDHRAAMAARAASAETETMMAREDQQDRATPRTEDRARVMETDVDSVRAKAIETEMETEMVADLAREDRRAARDVSEAKTVTIAAKDVSEDRSHRADSVPAVQEEAADLTQSSHQS